MPEEAIMVDGFAKTPRYVLREGAYPTCPCVVHSSNDPRPAVIYGFSDKPEYDAFLSNSSLALTPYPLVKGFLKNKIELDAIHLKLVVLDAASSQQDCLYAATFQSVLDSLQVNSDCVAVSHRLVLADSSSAYRIESYSWLPAEKPLP